MKMKRLLLSIVLFVILLGIVSFETNLAPPVVSLSFQNKSDMYLFQAQQGQGANLMGETVPGAYGTTPNVQYNLGNGASNKESIIVTAKSSTSVTVLVQLRTDVVGLLPSYAVVPSREVDFIITEK